MKKVCSSRKGTKALLFLAFSMVLTIAVLLVVRSSSPEAKGPRPVGDRLSLAKMALVDRMYAESERLLTDLLAENPNDLSARILLGRLLVHRGRTSEAISELTRVLKGDDRNVEALRNLASACRLEGQPETAAAYLNRALQLRKDDPELWKELGLLQKEMGDVMGAMTSLQASLRLDPKQSDASRAVADLATMKGGLAGLPGLPRVPRPESPFLDPLDPRQRMSDSFSPTPIGQRRAPTAMGGGIR